MQASWAFIVAFLCIQGFIPTESIQHKAHHASEKEYPYCNSISDPSISCNDRYPNGTLIDGTYPNPYEACSAFFFDCVDGVSYCFDCQREPEQLYYDPSRTRCDFCNRIPACVNAGKCVGGPDPTTTRSTSTTSRTTTIAAFQCPTSEGFYPINPDFCTADYYSCVDGSPYILTCPAGSVFDPIRLYCVSEELASCNIVLPDCPEPDGFFPIPGTCDGLHYVCVDGVANFQLCPGTSVFDPELLFCVADGTASCQTGGGTSTRATTTKKPDEFVCPGTGQFEYAPCSNLYYICSGNNPVIIAQCPPGQLFDPESAFCKDPSEIQGCSFREHGYAADRQAPKLAEKKIH